MRTLVLSILWGFARHFGTASEVPVMPGVEAWRMMGVWYPISVVMDHGGQKHLSIKGRFTLCTPPDSLYYDFYFIGDEFCYLEIVSFLVDERPGQFITESTDPEYDGCKARIVDTDYHEYNIFHMERDGNNTLILDGREPQVSATIKEKFKELASSLGFEVDKIVDVPLNNYCFAKRRPHGPPENYDNYDE